MTAEKPSGSRSPLPQAVGFLAGFLTLGIGTLRSVEPAELIVRTVVAGSVTYVVVRVLRLVWYQMSEDILNIEQ
ncbi:MAG: hypothetical protein RIK87_05885 [Fuerstiella sp.]